MVDDKSQEPDQVPGADLGARPDDAGKRTRTPPTIDLEASRVEKPGSGAAPPDARNSDDEQSESLKSNAGPSTGSSARIVPGLIGGAVAGAVVAAAISAAAWWVGASHGDHTQLTASTIATLETLPARVTRLERPQAPAPATATGEAPDAALTGRVDTLEKSLAALQTGIAASRSDDERLSKAVDEIKAAARIPAASETQPHMDAPKDAESNSEAAPDLSAIEPRLARLDAALQALSGDANQLKDAQAKSDQRVAALTFDQAKTVSADTVVLRRAVIATALDLAVRQGEPFASTLGAAKQGSGDASAFKALDGFAATGVPGAGALCRELVTLLAKNEPAPPPAGGSWFARLANSALRLVRFKQAGVVDGGDSSAILARAASAASRNDLAAAQREVMAMPEADRARLQPWLDRVASRDAALAATHQFSSDAMTALSESNPAN